MPEIANYGQIKRLVLPEQWREGATTHNGTHGPELREFLLSSHKDVRLCIYYRGFPLSTESGETFRQTLEMSPHFLTMEELANLDELLEDSSNLELFSPASAQTADIGGRRVLILEGRWIQQGWSTYSIYVSCDESGSVVQQIYFLAPVTDYPGLLPNVRIFLDSIEWVTGL